jgi:DNA-binding NarL/FixJ family response regulator
MPKPTRIITVDDHPLFRSALSTLLNRDPGLEVIAEASDGLEALEHCRSLKPDLVLMDVRMPKMDGIAATRAIKQELPRTFVLVMSASEDAEHLAEALKAGAAGYILKTAPSERIISAVYRTVDWEAPLDQELAKQLILSLTDEKRAEQVAEAGNPDPEISCGRLTPREVTVLRLIARGQTNQQIAKELLISTSTAKNHVQRILTKLGASDRTQAVVAAIEMGMLSNLKR